MVSTDLPAEKEKAVVRKNPTPHSHALYESVKVVFDRENGEYEPGSIAEMLIVSPVYPAKVLNIIYNDNYRTYTNHFVGKLLYSQSWTNCESRTICSGGFYD